MLTSKNNWLLLICLTAFVACKKQAPKPSTDGSNTIYYKIGDNAHLIKGTIGMFTQQGVQSYNLAYTDHLLVISSRNQKDAIYDDVDFYITDSPKLNVRYPLNGTHGENRSQYQSDESTYYADSAQSYIILSRFDASVISGTFEFSGTDKNQQTIRLNDGWFDVSRK